MISGPADKVDFGALRRVLVVKLRHHGDVLLSTPVFSVLKRHAPQAQVDALVYADTREMLEGHPAIDRIQVVDRSWRSLPVLDRLGREWGLLGALRERRYDLLIHLTDHPRGAWLARLLGCRYSVAPGYGGRSRFWKRSFTHHFALPLNARRHMVEWNLDAVRRLGLQPELSERKLLLKPDAESEASVSRLLNANGLGDSDFVLWHAPSRWSFKCWPAKRTAAAIDALAARGCRVVLTAAPSREEMELVRSIMALAQSSPVDLSGRLTLRELAVLAARARLFVGVDSAPMHIAAAAGTPVVALFGPSGEAEWGPWGGAHRVVASELHPCRPCGRDGCGGSKRSDCLESLPETRVIDAVDELLAQ